MKRYLLGFVSIGVLAISISGCGTTMSSDDSPYLNGSVGLGNRGSMPVYELGYYHSQYNYYTTVSQPPSDQVVTSTMISTSTTCCGSRISTCCSSYPMGVYNQHYNSSYQPTQYYQGY